MDERTKELIAIGAAIAGHCQPCLTHHVARAKELGVGEDEIREAVAVGQRVERGALAAMQHYSKQVMGEPLSPSPVSGGRTSDTGSPCGG